MMKIIFNMIPQGSFFKKKRSWLYTVFAVIGAFLFIAAKQAPQDKITVVAPEISGVKAIVFDVGDVLLETINSVKISLFIPIILKNPTLLYKLLSLDAKKAFFEILSTIPAQNTYPIYNKGKELPMVLGDWQSGFKTPQEMHLLANQAIENSNYSIAEKNLFFAIADIMFIPEKLVYSQTIALPMAKLLKKFKEAGYQIYILSNWDEQSFALAQQKYPKLFECCTEIFISGKEKLSKPHPEFYTRLLSKRRLKAEECVFIDDEPYNIAAAQKLGFKAIQHKNAVETCKELIKCHIITIPTQN